LQFVTEPINNIMKKAKIILIAIAIFAIVGGTLALKTVRFNENQLWTVTGITTISSTCTIGGLICTATIPACTRINLYATDDSPIFITNARSTVPAFVKCTVVGGTATCLIPFGACPTFSTFVTIIP
jgi:hypothetical protein